MNSKGTQATRNELLSSISSMLTKEGYLPYFTNAAEISFLDKVSGAPISISISMHNVKPNHGKVYDLEAARAAYAEKLVRNAEAAKASAEKRAKALEEKKENRAERAAHNAARLATLEIAITDFIADGGMKTPMNATEMRDTIPELKNCSILRLGQDLKKLVAANVLVLATETPKKTYLPA